MVMIQDGPQNTGADKPLRITGDPYKVQVIKFIFYKEGFGVDGRMGKRCMNNYNVLETCFLNWVLFLL